MPEAEETRRRVFTKQQLLEAGRRLDAVPDRGSDAEYYRDLLATFSDFEPYRQRAMAAVDEPDRSWIRGGRPPMEGVERSADDKVQPFDIDGETSNTCYGYSVYLERLTEEDGGGWLASVPELYGCISTGETPDEALQNIKDALTCYISSMREWGRTMVAPRFHEEPRLANPENQKEARVREWVRMGDLTGAAFWIVANASDLFELKTLIVVALTEAARYGRLSVSGSKEGRMIGDGTGEGG